MGLRTTSQTDKFNDFAKSQSRLHAIATNAKQLRDNWSSDAQ